MKIQIKRIVAILLAVLFLVTVTAGTVSAGVGPDTWGGSDESYSLPPFYYVGPDTTPNQGNWDGPNIYDDDDYVFGS